MANVPGVLIVGGTSVQGGTAAISNTVTGLNVSELNSSHAGDVMRVTPDDPTTGNPTATALGWRPWFDGNAGDNLYTCSTSSSNTVKATGTPGWTVNQWAGMTVSVTGWDFLGTSVYIGFTDRKTIVSNTADTLTISGTWTTNPTAATPVSLFFIGQGRWRDYHPDAGRLTASEVGVAFATRSGSGYMNGGVGVGVDAGLIRQFYAHTWPTAPYFQMAKWFTATPTWSAFDDTTGSRRAAFVLEKARYDAAWAALANGNTLAWELLVLDLSQEDVADWASNPTHYLVYKTKIEQTIAWFRTTLGNASLKVVLVNHDNLINSVLVPAGTTLANRVHRTVAAADPLVRCASMQGLETYLVAPYDPDANRGGYASHVYWDAMATRVREAYELLAAGAPTEITGGVPVHMMIGDSIFTGGITETFLGELKSPTITLTPRDARQGIFAADTSVGEPYDACDNSNTSGTTGAVAGPECSMTVEWQRLHPATGSYLVKRSAVASSLIGNVTAWSAGGAAGGRWSRSYEATEHFGALKDLWDSFCHWCNNTLGKQADLKDITVCLGTNDGAVAGGGALFAAELATFVADLRAVFQTRTSGDPLPIIWRQPQLAAATAIADEAVAIREALAAYALTDPEFALVDVDDLERETVSNVHETPDATLIDGQRLVAAGAAIAI
jgi:hypothetical protein